MAWYFIIDTYIDENKRRGEYDAYIAEVKPIVESYGGRYLVRTENVLHFGGDRTPQRVIVIRFESKENLERCFSSPEYRAIMNKRTNSVDSRALIAEGLE